MYGAIKGARGERQVPGPAVPLPRARARGRDARAPVVRARVQWGAELWHGCVPFSLRFILLLLLSFSLSLSLSLVRASVLLFARAFRVSCVLRCCTLCFVRHVMQHSMRVRWFSRPIFARCVGAPRRGCVSHARSGRRLSCIFFPSGVLFTCCVVRARLAWAGSPAGDGAYANCRCFHSRIPPAGACLFYFSFFFCCTWMLS